MARYEIGLEALLLGIPVAMKTVQEYLRHADQCEALTRGDMLPAERQMIHKMAETWRMLAEQRKKNLVLREKVGTDSR